MAQKMPRRNRKMLGIRIKPKEGLWVNYQLRLKGINQTDLSRKLGINQSTITNVLAGKRRSVRVEEALYQALGYPSFEAMIAASRGKGKVV